MERILAAVILITLSGCATVKVPPNLTEPCEPLPKLSAGDKQALFNWLVDSDLVHRDCMNRHKRLVEAL